ncbi:MAG: flagellar basal-body MS-ring/collar protein FliF, partial [Planctomycetota bacterium]|nr:flagellar basal-body MS-ring/collar protein FliF [Planctomycetota bacterium]
MTNSLQGVMEAWRRMGLVQRVMLISVLLACVGAAWLLVGWAREPHMALLYSRLDPEDAADVIAEVQDADVAYELKDGGTSIYVPSEKVYALRLQLAGEGLPTGGQQGYRILDTEKIGTSPFTQRVNYIRALEGELAKTIALIDGVEHARIHIVRTESRLFHKAEGGTSATVAIRVRPGRRLSPGNVAAIVHMVAGGVERLDPENVVVVDSHGTLLSTGTEGGFAGTGGTVLDYKSQVEQYLAKKAEQMLTLVLGPGRATVKVNADVETSTINTTEEKYSPDGGVPIKEEITSKTESPGAKQGGTGSQNKEEITIMEYQVGRTVAQTINMPGKIVSLSVAAFVDLSPPESAGETAAEEGEAAAPPAPALTAQDVEDVIRGA